MEYLLDQTHPDNVEIISNVEAPLAELKLIKDEEQKKKKENHIEIYHKSK
jgi:hypothetical protein